MKLRGEEIVTLANARAHELATSAVWAYFRQLPMKESRGAVTRVVEEALFAVDYRTGITKDGTIRHEGVEREIAGIDTFGRHKQDLALYLKRKSA